MSKKRVLVAVTSVLAACGGVDQAPPPDNEPVVDPVCATNLDAQSGQTDEVKGAFNFRYLESYYSANDQLAILYFKIAAKADPDCEAIHFTDVPFSLIGNRLPEFDRFALFSLNPNERGVWADGTITSQTVSTEAMISVLPGQDKFYALAIWLSKVKTGQGFTISLDEPVVWHTPTDLTDRYTVLDEKLSAHYNF